MAIHLAELERVTSLARTVVAPLADMWSARSNSTVSIDSPAAERVTSDDLAASLSGTYWVLPVEVTGVHNGVTCLLVPKDGIGELTKSFSDITDDFLAYASDRLTGSLGGPVSLDRLGLREAPSDSTGAAVVEALGPGGLVAVHFNISVPEQKTPGDLVVVFGGRLLRELSTPPTGGAETLVTPQAAPVRQVYSPAPAPSAPAVPPPVTRVETLLERARGLQVNVSAEICRRRMTLGELLTLAPGRSLDTGRTVTDPLELWVGRHRIGYCDAINRKGAYGIRMRGTED